MDSQYSTENNIQDLLTFLEARNSIFSPITSPSLNTSIENLESFENFENSNNIFEYPSNPIDYTTPYSINPSDTTLVSLDKDRKSILSISSLDKTENSQKKRYIFFFLILFDSIIYYIIINIIYRKIGRSKRKSIIQQNLPHGKYVKKS